MKNLIIYTNKRKAFTGENKTLIKIQIDSALALGWKPEDILIYTNFEYEYNGVKSILVPDIYHNYDPTSNKLPIIVYLMQNKLLEDDLCWYHDVDAFQNTAFDEKELGLQDFDMGLTTYGFKKYRGGEYWNGGSYFFKLSSQDIFELWLSESLNIRRTRSDEKTLVDITYKNLIARSRYKTMNLRYNFGQYGPKYCYEMATKPLMVLHFHPYYEHYPKDCHNIDVFMHGKNKYNIPMMSDTLISVFKKHNIQ